MTLWEMPKKLPSLAGFLFNQYADFCFQIYSLLNQAFQNVARDMHMMQCWLGIVWAE